MRKHPFAAIITCLICAALLTGCGAGSDSDPAAGQQNVKEDAAEEDTVDEGTAKEDTVKEDVRDGEDPAPEPAGDDEKTEETDLDLAEAFRQGQVYNNGSYFVRIKDKVYFRNISPESMEEGAAFGEFLRNEFHTVNTSLIAYDINTCKWEEIGTVAGTGELYACPGGFLLAETVPEMWDAGCTNLYDPVTKETTLYCDGLPLGISESGRILAVEKSGGQNIETVLVKDGEEIARLGGEGIFYEVVGFSGETLIVIFHTANEEYMLCSVDENGDVTNLGMIGNSDNGYARPSQLLTFGDDIYVCIGYYEGSGHFLNRWEVVRAKPGSTKSLVLAFNSDGASETYDSEGSDPNVPVIYIDDTGSVNYTDHMPYVAFLGEGNKKNDLLYYNDVYDETVLVKDFMDRTDPDDCAIIQDIESINETAFVIYADAVADSEYDTGWRTGYRMTGWHICAIPFDSGNIIHFFDKGSGTDNR